jgi:hypothetical protein
MTAFWLSDAPYLVAYTILALTLQMTDRSQS